MENVNIYLAGGMGNLSYDEYTRWRTQFINNVLQTKIDIINNPVITNPTDYYNFEYQFHKTEHEIKEFELQRIRKSDVVVVNFNDEKSIGTAMELAVAKENRIFIVGINENKKNIHPWLVDCVDRMCDTIEEAVDYVIQYFLN